MLQKNKYANKKWIDEKVIKLIREKDKKYKKAVITGIEDDWNEYKNIHCVCAPLDNIITGMLILIDNY